VNEIRPFELRSFDEEVEVQQELLRIRAQVKAAEADRDRIREEARREGLELGRKEGREAAAQAERERVGRECAPLAGVLEKAGSALEEARRGILARAERDLLTLALEIARRVLKAEASRGAATPLENLTRALELTARRQEVRIEVHPEDLALVEAYLPTLRRRFADLGSVAFEAAESVGRGGARVRTREGSVDASIAAQLEEIERGLLG
jgi:flagellar assembly protein FliH